MYDPEPHAFYFIKNLPQAVASQRVDWGGGLGILSLDDNGKENETFLCYMAMWKKFFAERASPTSSKLLKDVVTKISSEVCGPKRPDIIVHPSLFCLATQLTSSSKSSFYVDLKSSNCSTKSSLIFSQFSLHIKCHKNSIETGKRC